MRHGKDDGTEMEQSARRTPEGAPTWTHHDELPAFTPFPGFTLRVFAGERLLTAWIRMEPGAVVPRHHHVNEQLGVILEGVIDLTVGDETRRLVPGGAWVIPGDVPHSGVAGPDGCLLLESFAPPREDYLAQAAAAENSRRGSQ